MEDKNLVLMDGKIVHPTSESFDSLIKKSGLVLVDFWAIWCGPCKMIAPIIEKIADEYESQVVVAKVDIDEQDDLAERFNVQSIPTVMLFKNGQVVATEVGVKSLETYKTLIDNNL